MSAKKRASSSSEPSGGEASTPSPPPCPNCGSALELYAGKSPHKLGTGFCDKCGQRVAIAEDGA